MRFPFGLVAACQKHSQVIEKPSYRLLLPSLESQASTTSAPGLTFVSGSRSTCSPQNSDWKILALLGLHLQRSFYSLKLDTCLTCNTNIVPERKSELATNVVPALGALQESRYQTWLLYFMMPLPPSAHHMKTNESTFLLNQRKTGEPRGDHMDLWHAFSWANESSWYSPEAAFHWTLSPHLLYSHWNFFDKPSTSSRSNDTSRSEAPFPSCMRDPELYLRSLATTSFHLPH